MIGTPRWESGATRAEMHRDLMECMAWLKSPGMVGRFPASRPTPLAHASIFALKVNAAGVTRDVTGEGPDARDSAELGHASIED